MFVLVDSLKAMKQSALIQKNDRYLEMHYHFVGDIYFHHWWKYLATNQDIEKSEIYRYNYSCNPSLVQWFLYDHHHLDDVPLLDSIKYHTISKDKTCQIIYMDRHHYKYPETLIFAVCEDNISHIVSLTSQFIWYPCIIKYPWWSRGEEVFLAHSSDELKEILKNSKSKTCILQEFIHNDGDIRIYVVWDEVIGCMHRYNPNSFKNNISLWWNASPIRINQDVQDSCVALSKWFGLDIAGIDIMYKKDSNIRYVIEINDMPDNILFGKICNIEPNHNILYYAYEKLYTNTINNADHIRSV
jgi:gamma-F420-2:alpha-L-glutamate ligase